VRLLPAIVAALLLTGCGLGAGKGASNVQELVTRDFGGTVVGSSTVKKTKGSETVMRLLERGYRVNTRFGGGFVQSIDGVAGASGRRVDWFYYVNGIEAGKGAAATRVHPGDHIWWDRHDWSAAMRVPAVVGSFPEPFVHGTGGKRVPVRIECTQSAEQACDTVTARLAKVGVPVGRAALGSEVGADTLRILVGTFAGLGTDLALRQIRQGPASSGVYAKPAGGELRLLDSDGHVARTLGAGAGLVAATRVQEQLPTWVIGGVDAAGVDAAASALTSSGLSHRFALAIRGTQRIAVPAA
jgi:Domain of unknown function (DUF4430)